MKRYKKIPFFLMVLMAAVVCLSFLGGQLSIARQLHSQRNRDLKTTDREIINAYQADGFTEKRFDRLLTFIKATDRENRWLEPNWSSSIPLATQQAVAKGKPIFLWAMNGDPLGCV